MKGEQLNFGAGFRLSVANAKSQGTVALPVLRISWVSPASISSIMPAFNLVWCIDDRNPRNVGWYCRSEERKVGPIIFTGEATSGYTLTCHARLEPSLAVRGHPRHHRVRASSSCRTSRPSRTSLRALAMLALPSPVLLLRQTKHRQESSPFV